MPPEVRTSNFRTADPLGVLPACKERVAHYVALGWSDKDIAAALGVSLDTVTYHIRGIVKLWHLDPRRNRRVQITRRVMSASTAAQRFSGR